MNTLKLSEVVSTYEVNPISSTDDAFGDLKFRIEILFDKERKKFSPLIYRWDLFRIQPTFPQQENQSTCDLADHEVLIKDPAIDCSDIVTESEEEALERVLHKFRKIFVMSV
jgi:hypothetical protein